MTKPFRFSSLIALVCLLLWVENTSAQFTIDSTKVDTSTLISGLETPWEMLWGPEGFLWLTERKGYVSRINTYTGDREQLLDISNSILYGDERGLMGMALHPDFADTPFVYLAYTYSGLNSDKVALVRYEYNGTDLTAPFIFSDTIDSQIYHNGARLVISPDRKLMVSTGDGLNAFNALNLGVLNGKILRFNLDGSIPSDNPFPNSAIWSFGHRNPQGLAYGPSGYLYSSEHGPNSDDEFQIIQKGKSYGWPNVWGYCDSTNPLESQFCGDTSMIEPLIAWTPTIAPSDIYWYDHPAIPEWQQSFLMAVLKDKMITAIHLNSSGEMVTNYEYFFKNKFGRIRDICAAPDGRIFLATNGQVYGGSPAPTNKIIVMENPDYTHVVSCSIPQNPSSQVIGPNNIRLSWNPVIGAMGYLLEGKAVANSKKVQLYIGDGTTSFIDIGNLNSSLDYIWAIRAICSDGATQLSSFNTFNIGDSITCTAPDSIFHSNLTSTSAALSWSPSVGTLAYEVVGRQMGLNGIVRLMVNAPQTQLVVNNLNPGTGYEWSVRSVCDALQTVNSDYTRVDTFFTIVANKTPDILDNETFNQGIKVTPNPFNQTVQFKFIGLDFVNYNLYITNMKGLRVCTHVKQDSKTLRISLDDNPPGIYFYQITSEDFNIYQGKLIKL